MSNGKSAPGDFDEEHLVQHIRGKNCLRFSFDVFSRISLWMRAREREFSNPMMRKWFLFFLRSVWSCSRMMEHDLFHSFRTTVCFFIHSRIIRGRSGFFTTTLTESASWAWLKIIKPVEHMTRPMSLVGKDHIPYASTDGSTDGSSAEKATKQHVNRLNGPCRLLATAKCFTLWIEHSANTGG